MSRPVGGGVGIIVLALVAIYFGVDPSVVLNDRTMMGERDLKERHGAPGDFAQAYVIAHEIGHHVQALLGISERVHVLRNRVSTVEANRLSVQQELQADCLAGVWAHHAHRARQVLEEGDIEEALNAASSIGDDRLQRQSRGYVAPESFTHGTSAQRVRWFRRGIESGDIGSCETFAADSL